jgi:predicted TIM-barrel fold metal-dependent hydrolase
MTMPLDAGAQATRDYVAREAASRTAEGLVELVESDVARLHALADGFPPERLRTPLDGDWTPMDCVTHVASRTMVRAREVLYVALSGELPPPEEVSLPDDLPGVLAKHREAMDSLYAHVRDAPDDFKAFTWNHPVVGPMTWPEWMVFVQAHLDDHCQQLERMAAAA